MENEVKKIIEYFPSCSWWMWLCYTPFIHGAQRQIRLYLYKLKDNCIHSLSNQLCTVTVIIHTCIYILQYVSKLTPSLMSEIDKILGNKPAAKREVVTRWLDSRTPSAAASGPGHGSTSHPVKGGSSEVGGATCSVQWSTKYKHLSETDYVLNCAVILQFHKDESSQAMMAVFLTVGLYPEQSCQ